MTERSRRISNRSRYSEGSVSPITRPMDAGNDDMNVTTPFKESGAALRIAGGWRRATGLLLLATTVFLWTASNFLASEIFANDSYSKPYFVTYINTATFILPLIPIITIKAWRRPKEAKLWPREFVKLLRRASIEAGRQENTPYFITSPDAEASQELLLDDSQQLSAPMKDYDSLPSATSGATVPETAKLALEFCVLWFAANYFAASCLEYTTVASATILTSTSSVFTLAIGSLFRVERFNLRKLCGVLASLAGVVMISSIDLSRRKEDDEQWGDFPEKNVRELAIGNALALLSALFYGIYAVFMKARIGDESRVNMPLFFGLVGCFNVALFWPGFLILHWTGVEPFEMPSTGFVWLIVVSNSIASLISDMAWAFAVLLTSPIVVTVGLSMTIPLSLFGEIILNNQTVTALYWVGAGIVVLSFLFINHEETIHEKAISIAADDSIADQLSGPRDTHYVH